MKTSLRAAAIASLLTAAMTAACILPATAQNPAVSVSINVTANRHPINPLVYGVSGGSATALSDLNVPLTRYGGNNTSRYNWQLNADNRGSDWYFESIGESDATPGARGDTFIATANNAGAQAMVTIPMIGWVANLGSNRSKLASFLVSKYGAQQAVDPYWSDAGNGVLTSGAYVTGNNPADASVKVDSTYQQGWVQHIVGKWGTAANGGLRYYILDNEPSIWHGTHRDVHPTGATMDEVVNDTIDYASKIKAVDPSAMVVGPEEWGWSGYFYSGYDQQYGGQYGWSYLPDRTNHGGWDYLPYYLNTIHQHDTTYGARTLDVFSVHYYPQGGEYSNDVSSTTELLRNRSTRSLWDPNYVDQSWINTTVMLIPRIKNWVSTYYPGLKTAITEYNWGAEGYINGATAQADIYGIFGREGLDMAARWATPSAATPTYNAMKLYRNYDGSKSTFGDISVSCQVPNPDNLSAFAAQRSSDGTLTVMVVSKVLSGDTPVSLNLAGFTGVSSQAWQLTSANVITRLSDLPVSNGVLSATVPAQSVTLFVVAPAQATVTVPAAPTGITASAGNGQAALAWNASTGAATYNLYRGATSGGEGTVAYRTGLTSTSFTDTGLTNGVTYYYQVSAVNSAGESARSSEVSVTPQAPVAPAAPTNLVASPGKARVALSWTQSTSASLASNRIYRATSAAGPFALVATVNPTTSYTDTSVARRRTYYYQVTAVGSNGLESAPSNTVAATTR